MSEREAVVDAAAVRTPNFLVVGAAKSGTSALWHYLRQHPEVYLVPRKHTRFFVYDDEYPEFRGPPPKDPGTPYSIVELEDYRELFRGANAAEKAVGETSWTYLYRPEAPGRIREFSPGMKIIAILRHPTDRAYSHYRQNVRAGREPIGDFARALEEEATRVREGWWPEFHYVSVGLYHDQVKRYLEKFDRDQIKLYLYEDFDLDPAGFLRDVLRFLEVDDAFAPEAFVRFNSAGTPKSRGLHLFLQSMKRLRPAVERFVPSGPRRRIVRAGSNLHKKNLRRPQLTPQDRRRVTDEYFRQDILNLQELVGRDLSAWLS